MYEDVAARDVIVSGHVDKWVLTTRTQTNHVASHDDAELTALRTMRQTEKKTNPLDASKRPPAKAPEHASSSSDDSASDVESETPEAAEAFLREEGASDDEIMEEVEKIKAKRVPKAKHPTVASPGVSKQNTRNGYNVLYKGRRIGAITSWCGNVSCKCHTHTQCGLPAKRLDSLDTDAPLVNWLLAGVSLSGKPRLTPEQHRDMWSEA